MILATICFWIIIVNAEGGDAFSDMFPRLAYVTLIYVSLAK